MIFNPWNYKFLKNTDIWGLYWECTDFSDIHRLFKIPYDDLMHIVYVLSKEMNLSYHDIKEMSFFEILDILDVYKENMEEQEKQNKEENQRMEKQMTNMQSRYNMNDFKNQMNNPSSITNSYQPPNIQTPNFNIPKI